MPVFPSHAAAESFSKESGRNMRPLACYLLPVFRKALPFSQMYEIVVDTATL